MLSFNKGFPIAKIKGGKYNNRNIKLYLEDKKELSKPCCKKCKGGCLQCGGSCCSKCFDNFMIKAGGELSKLELNQDDPLYPLQVELKKRKDGNFEEITIEDGEVIPLPQKQKNEKENQTDSLYIAGPKGSGKSTYVASYVKEFKKLYPKRKVYLFSHKEEDKVLDDIKVKGKRVVKRINIGQNLLDNPIDYKMFKKSLVIFDDIEMIPKEFKKTVYDLLNTILKCGRSQDIYTMMTNHQLTSYKETRDFLNESNMIVMFPGNSSTNGINNVMKYYGGYKQGDVDKILSLNSRWVSFHKNSPNYILHENGAYLMNRKIKKV